MFEASSVDNGNYGVENFKVSFVAAFIQFRSLPNEIAYTHSFCRIVAKTVGIGSVVGVVMSKIVGSNSKGWLSNMV